MTTTKIYDGLNRLASINSAPVIGDPLTYAYQYDAAGQREQVTLANNDTWAYGYNSRGEVISGSKKQGGTTNLLGYQFGYAFDDIGNRTSATREGRVSAYTANSLNQYTQRTVPGYLHVIGSAKPTATVTVNDESTTRQGEAFYKELSVDNTSQPVYQATQVKAVLGADTAEVNGNVFVPKTAELFTYDQDGNLLTDGRWIYRWNGENRLIEMETQPWAATAGALKQRLTFTYDHRGRRISKKVEDWKDASYRERFTMLFLYDGWNLSAEVLATGPKIRTYAWGSDLSRGNAVGGVEGLLLIKQYPENKTYSVGYDGRGNVVALFDMEANGALSASYEYGPFGERLKSSGTMASIIPIRFSTKYTDQETDLVYYGNRFLKPITGRWISRDPIEERGGVNIYSFVFNSPIERIDILGLMTDVDRMVLDHATQYGMAYSMGGEPTPSLSINSEKVRLRGEAPWDIFKTLKSKAEELCSKCGGLSIDEAVSYDTIHIWSLGKISVRVKGTLAAKQRSGSVVYWELRNGTAEPLSERFDFYPLLNDRGKAGEIMNFGGLAATWLGFLGNFDITFTGPVKITSSGSINCK